MRVHEFPKVVGFFNDTAIFYTSYALNVFHSKETALLILNEPGYITFCLPCQSLFTVAVFKIKWKGGVR